MRRLRAVDAPEDGLRRDALASFCGHCGSAPTLPAAEPRSRVCGRCGLGLVLSAARAVAPVDDEPFLVVDSSLSVCAVSAQAEELLRIDETHAVNRHIADFLVPADADAPGADNLHALLVDAAAGSGEPRTTVVRPREEFGVRFHARIGSCGPPHAALLVLTA